jgi:hypothetical protein
MEVQRFAPRRGRLPFHLISTCKQAYIILQGGEVVRRKLSWPGNTELYPARFEGHLILAFILRMFRGFFHRQQ